jgi:hypothetical protein
LLLDYEGPFNTLERIGWEVVDHTELVATGTMPPSQWPSPELGLPSASALDHLVKCIDWLYEQQLTIF